MNRNRDNSTNLSTETTTCLHNCSFQDSDQWFQNGHLFVVGVETKEDVRFLSHDDEKRVPGMYDVPYTKPALTLSANESTYLVLLSIINIYTYIIIIPICLRISLWWCRSQMILFFKCDRLCVNDLSTLRYELVREKPRKTERVYGRFYCPLSIQKVSSEKDDLRHHGITTQ